MPVAAVIALLAGAMLTAVFANPSIPLAPPVVAGTAKPVTTSSQSPDDEMFERSPGPGGARQALPEWLANVLSALCAAAIVSIFLTMAWLLWRDRLAQRRALRGDVPP